MYVIVVYDVSVEKVGKVCQFLREYLNWIQNSVFEGELTQSELAKVKSKLKELINEERDSVIFFKVASQSAFGRETLGTEKVNLSSII